jgi:hypothetical protein
VGGGKIMAEGIRTKGFDSREKRFDSLTVALAFTAGVIICAVALKVALVENASEANRTYTQEYKGSCEIWNVCNYTKQLICTSMSCGNVYGCWEEKRNCSGWLKNVTS